MSVWRIQSNTSRADIAGYCIENNIAAIGWSLSEYTNRETFDNLSFEEYYSLAKPIYDSKPLSNVTRLAKDVKPNDIIWIRHNGFYYLARITNNSEWSFNNTDEAYSKDACNQLSNIVWYPVGDESDIPGALSTSFIRGNTLQRINKDGILEYSELMYDRISNDGYKYNRKIEFNESIFYSLISPTDCEDLLYIYSYKKSNKNFVCIPSTNKIATEKYEFVALDAETGKHIYYQAKNGKVPLNSDDYLELVRSTNNEVYLVSTRGNVFNSKKYEQIHVIDPTELFEFACGDENVNIIPPSIQYWIEFAGGYNIPLGRKGIMIDTNDTWSENYLFDHNVIAAWGTPKRYIDAFNKRDYVFYYKKWYGIIAVGEILDEISTEIKDGKERNVKMIVPPRKNDNGDYYSIKPAEIKECLKKSFFFASTRKVPFLSDTESKILIKMMNNK